MSYSCRAVRTETGFLCLFKAPRWSSDWISNTTYRFPSFFPSLIWFLTLLLFFINLLDCRETVVETKVFMYSLRRVDLKCSIRTAVSVLWTSDSQDQSFGLDQLQIASFTARHGLFKTTEPKLLVESDTHTKSTLVYFINSSRRSLIIAMMITRISWHCHSTFRHSPIVIIRWLFHLDNSLIWKKTVFRKKFLDRRCR